MLQELGECASIAVTEDGRSGAVRTYFFRQKIAHLGNFEIASKWTILEIKLPIMIVWKIAHRVFGAEGDKTKLQNMAYRAPEVPCAETSWRKITGSV